MNSPNSSLFTTRDFSAEIRLGSDGIPEGQILRDAYPYLKDVKSDFRLMGFPAALYPFAHEVSPARMTMNGKQQAQAVVIAQPEHKHCYSGLETDHGTYCVNSSRREEDIEILLAIPKYRVHLHNLGAKEIPMWLVIYRSVRTKIIDCFEINKYESCAEGWGYKNNWNEHNIRKYLREGEILLKEVELSSPPTSSGPRYMSGTNANVCYMPMSEADQDAIVVSDRFLEKIKAFGVHKEQGTIPPNYLPLPIYATRDYPDKWFPDIGETIPEDGTICVFRKMNIDRFSADAASEALREYDPNLDVVIKGEPGGKIADVNFLVNRQYLEEVPQQIRMYVEDNRQYYRSIVGIAEKYRTNEMGGHFGKVVTEAVCRLVGMNEKVAGIDPKDKPDLDGPKNSIVDYVHVEFTVFHEIKAQSGTKKSGQSGCQSF